MKYSKGQVQSNNNNNKGGNASRKTKRNNAESIHVTTNRIRRGVETIRWKTSTWFGNAMFRRYARIVDRLHQR